MATSEAGPLGQSAIQKAMAEALPAHDSQDDSPAIKSPYEAIALAVHAYLALLDFRLVGFDEARFLPECESLAPRLPPTWNQRHESVSLVYKHKESSMVFVVRVDRLGSKAEVRGLAVGDEKIYRIEYAVKDVVRESALPLRIADDEDHRGGALAERVGGLFAGNALERIAHDVKVQIVQRLIPGLERKGYSEEVDGDDDDVVRRPQQGRHNPSDPARPAGFEPVNPYGLPPQPLPQPASARYQPPMGDFPPPGFEDEHQINSPPGMMGGLRMPGQGGHPFNIGHDDLNPSGLGPHDPLRASFVGGRGGPRAGGFSGMHPTFDDPLFTGQGRGRGEGPDEGFYDPQAPPGARWDPVGPGGGPRFGGPGRGGGWNGGGGFGGGGFGFGGGDII
ncbi:PI31 proteasome regulator N-terminal domain-containing protein [Trichoderma novae-zelandiae]